LYYDQNTFDPHESPRMMLLNESISALQQNQLFWKSKVIHMISILNNLNALLPHFQDLHLLERFLDLIKKLST
jgi:hypothetical protein